MFACFGNQFCHRVLNFLLSTEIKEKIERAADRRDFSLSIFLSLEVLLSFFLGVGENLVHEEKQRLVVVLVYNFFLNPQISYQHTMQLVFPGGKINFVVVNTTKNKASHIKNYSGYQK